MTDTCHHMLSIFQNIQILLLLINIILIKPDAVETRLLCYSSIICQYLNTLLESLPGSSSVWKCNEFQVPGIKSVKISRAISLLTCHRRYGWKAFFRQTTSVKLSKKKCVDLAPFAHSLQRSCEIVERGRSFIIQGGKGVGQVDFKKIKHPFPMCLPDFFYTQLSSAAYLFCLLSSVFWFT